MLARLSGKGAYAHEQAERAARLATMNPELRKEYLRLETSWLILAYSFEFAERISGYLEWSARRLEEP